eukprot:1593744-Rhodomonas_salina.1
MFLISVRTKRLYHGIRRTWYDTEHETLLQYHSQHSSIPDPSTARTVAAYSTHPPVPARSAFVLRRTPRLGTAA